MRPLAAGFALSLISTLTLVKLDPWCMRFTFFFPALLCIAAARMGETFRGASLVLGAAALVEFLGTFLSYDLPASDFRTLTRQSWRDRSAVSLHGISIPEDAREIACYGAFSGGEYLLYGPDYSRRVVHLRSRSSSDLIRDLETLEIRYLHARPSDNEEKAVLRELVSSGRLMPIDERFYRVR